MIFVNRIHIVYSLEKLTAKSMKRKENKITKEKSIEETNRKEI